MLIQRVRLLWDRRCVWPSRWRVVVRKEGLYLYFFFLDLNFQFFSIVFLNSYSFVYSSVTLCTDGLANKGVGELDINPKVKLFSHIKNIFFNITFDMY